MVLHATGFARLLARLDPDTHKAGLEYERLRRSLIRFFDWQGATLPDPDRLLQGTGKFMRHVKLRPGAAANAAGLMRLIEAAYSDIKARIENG